MAVLAALLAGAFLPALVSAAPPPSGSLDTSFGSGGEVLTDFGGIYNPFEGVSALAIQGNGQIVAAGRSVASGSYDFALARYGADGSLDASFGNGGKVLTDFSGSGSDDHATALAIQDNGKIVVAGYVLRYGYGGYYDFALARYNADGSLDTSFGSGGKVVTDFSGSGSYDRATALAIQSNGKIVAAGSSYNGSYDFDFALARYNADGSLDTTFGSGGKALTDFSGRGSGDGASALAIQANGRIVAAGSSYASGSTDFALARYNADGSLDTDFGSGGEVLTDFSGGGSFDFATALAIRGNGQIVAAGASAASPYAYAAGSADFALARYNADGSLDTSFGSGGKVLTDFSGSGNFDQANALAIQSNGQIVAAGLRRELLYNGNVDFALARYSANGSLDTGFGNGGEVLTDFGGSHRTDFATALAIRSNGQIVAAGSSYTSGFPDFALARYNP